MVHMGKGLEAVLEGVGGMVSDGNPLGWTAVASELYVSRAVHVFSCCEGFGG